MSNAKIDKSDSSHAPKKVSVRREMVVRLIKDIKEVNDDHELLHQGIYYEHNMDNFLEGHAMLIGPNDTPYAEGLFFFHFTYPEDYPYSPPSVKFLTRAVDNRVRINPNLYIEGKVCLSLLNTWEGEPWSACQTIRSILLTLITVLNNKPLMNEPGIKENSNDHHPYNKIIRYTSLNDCFLIPMKRCLNDNLHTHEKLFQTHMIKHFISKFDTVEQSIQNMDFMINFNQNKCHDNIILQTRVYGLRVTLQPKIIISSLNNLKKNKNNLALSSKSK